jgi:hypothetical protein
MTHTVDSLMALAYKIRDARTYEWDVSEAVEAGNTLRKALEEALGFRPDWADFENGRECGRLEVEQLHNADPSCATVKLAEKILSDCGCSSNNTLLVSRIANRIDAHMQATQSVQKYNDFSILSITTAYEQGVGKGYQAFQSGKDIENPYLSTSDCAYAWILGYHEGKTQADRLRK